MPMIYQFKSMIKKSIYLLLLLLLYCYFTYTIYIFYTYDQNGNKFCNFIVLSVTISSVSAFISSVSNFRRNNNDKCNITENSPAL